MKKFGAGFLVAALAAGVGPSLLPVSADSVPAINVQIPGGRPAPGANQIAPVIDGQGQPSSSSDIWMMWSDDSTEPSTVKLKDVTQDSAILIQPQKSVITNNLTDAVGPNPSTPFGATVGTGYNAVGVAVSHEISPVAAQNQTTGVPTGTGILGTIINGQLRLCTQAISASPRCSFQSGIGPGLVKPAIVNFNMAISPGASPIQFIAWKQLDTSGSTYSTYWAPLAASGQINSSLINQVGNSGETSSQLAVAFIANTTTNATVSPYDPALVEDDGTHINLWDLPAAGGSPTAPVLLDSMQVAGQKGPQTGVTDISATTVTGTSPQIEIAWIEADSGANAENGGATQGWQLKAAQLTKAALSWQMTYNVSLDDGVGSNTNASCTAVGSQPPAGTGFCLSNYGLGGHVVLSKNPVSPTSIYLLYSGFGCSPSTTSAGAWKPCPPRAQVRWQVISSSAPAAKAPLQNPPLDSGGVGMGGLDLEGSNAAYAVQKSSAGSLRWVSYGTDVATTSTNSPTATSPSRGTARRSSLVTSTTNLAYLDDAANALALPTLTYVDLSAQSPAPKQVIVPGYTAGSAYPAGPLSVQGTVVAYVAQTPVTGGIQSQICGVDVNNSPAAGTICATPLGRNAPSAGDTSAGSSVFNPILLPPNPGSVIPGGVVWARSDGGIFSLWEQDYQGQNPANQIWSSQGLNPAISGISNVTLAGQQLFLTASQASSNPTDELFTTPVTGGAPTTPIYVTSRQRRITALAVEPANNGNGTNVAWIERDVISPASGTSPFASPGPYTGAGQAYLVQSYQAGNQLLPTQGSPGCQGTPLPKPCISAAPAVIRGLESLVLSDQNLIWSENTVNQSGGPANVPVLELLNLNPNAPAGQMGVGAPSAVTASGSSDAGALLPAIGIGGQTQPDSVSWVALHDNHAEYNEWVFSANIPTNSSTAPGTTGGGGGGGVASGAPVYVLDGYGGIHKAGTAQDVTQSAYFGFDIARGMVTTSEGHHGYVLDGYGGIHAFWQNGFPASSDPYISANWRPGTRSGGPNGWDIARGLTLQPGFTDRGYVLDGFGYLHPFGPLYGVGCAGCPTSNITYSDGWGASPAHPQGWDIARAVVMVPSTLITGCPPGTVNPAGGYIMDGYGGIHPFVQSGCNQLPGAVGNDYMGFDIARSLVLLPPGNAAKGYFLDGYGGVHGWSATGTPQPDPSALSDYWGDPINGGHADHANWDIARGMTMLPVAACNTGSGACGLVLDGYGGLHPFAVASPSNSAPQLLPNPSLSDYWGPNTIDGGANGWDIARGTGAAAAGANAPGSPSGSVYHPSH